MEISAIARMNVNRLLILLLSMLAVSAHAQGVLDLSAGIHRIQAELANSDETRAQGLMYRKSLGPNQGMLFVFPQTARHCMWMRNTLIPLAVAFIDEQGRILNVEEMQPQTENSHCASRPARFALEMTGGWFRSRGLGAGTVLSGIDRAPAPR